jgi:ATP/maltotriose-dependent transcriptional regulator MalT
MSKSLLDLPLDALTDCEREILRLLSQGVSDGELAERLVITVGRAKWYYREIYNTLDRRHRRQVGPHFRTGT